ncbi:hypothetical protein AU252_02615 [Pseudarthrobacter sulfonivorans]|uniref:Uncharacterized protein n=1 Tax=Pseudarthrobacter sulfonivorans TaxID=121292 RepID=A0A0U3FMU2_9MICC|nr:hypothetical protein [Pseudarthrobacter sulfonivorans]ALV40199.1 hypothetical protein AU252_02615 [Pseudarthrobacter sulfonivorans]
MNRPDSGSPDQSANQDDAVWLDLVARLEEKPATPTGTADPDIAASPGPDATGIDPETPGPAGPEAVAGSGRSATFRDFDPLGLAGTAPTELSAAERQAATPGATGQADAGERTGADSQGGPAFGPRDYAAEDDPGDFVPEEPPSLAGTDPLTMLAWLGAIGAPVALLLAVMFWRSAPLLAIVGMVAVFILAVVYLIMKLPQEKDENDDGARV